jgi:uncharacterized caspase-like protein
VLKDAGGALSFFYYSGHGVANSDTQINYLIPIDVTDTDDNKVWYESFQQNAVIDLLSRQAPNATHYVVFDACRNELNMTGVSAKALGTAKGFVPINDTSGLLVAYATAPRKTASDVGEGGGPYAKVLADELVKPGIEAVSMFRNVQTRSACIASVTPWSWVTGSDCMVRGVHATHSLKAEEMQGARTLWILSFYFGWVHSKPYLA